MSAERAEPPSWRARASPGTLPHAAAARIGRTLRRGRYPLTEVAALGRGRRAQEEGADPTGPDAPGPAHLSGGSVRGPAEVIAYLDRHDRGLRSMLTASVLRASRPSRVDPVTGLTWSGLTLLNPPWVDDAQFGERTVRSSLRRVITASPAGRVQSAYVFRHIWEHNIYHFVWDLLPQLLFAQRVGVDHLLIDERLRADVRFQRLVADNPRLPLANVLCSDSVIAVKRAVVGRVGWPTPALARWVTGIVAPEHAGPDRRILVVRAAGAGRSFVNFDEVSELADRYGLELVALEQLSFDEQMSLFAAARVVVAVHGAGLANVVFRGRRPLTVLELLPTEMLHPFYFTLVRCMEGDYRALPVPSAGAAPQFRLRDVTVPRDPFERALAALP